MSLNQYLAKQCEHKRFYTPRDVSVHNQSTDCWVVLFGRVFDLTRLLQENIALEDCLPIIANAGKDITYWFDQQTKHPKTKIDTDTAQQVHYAPLGKFLHLDRHGT